MSRELRLAKALTNNQTVFATFMLLKGARTAQVVANSGLDVFYILLNQLWKVLTIE